MTERQTRKARGLTYLVALGLASLAAIIHLLAMPSDPLPQAPISVGLLGMVLAFGLCELLVVHLRVHHQTHTISIGEIPLVVGLAVTAPQVLVVSRLVGTGLGQAAQRSLPLHKVAYYLARFYLETVVVVTLYRQILGREAVASPAGWAATLVAVFALQVVGAAAAALVITVNDRQADREQILRKILGPGALFSFANALVGLVGVTLLWYDPRTIWFAPSLAVITYGALRLYSVLSRRITDLTAVYRFHGSVGRIHDLDEIVHAILERVQAELHVTTAEIILARGANTVRYRRRYERLEVEDLGHTDLWGLDGTVSLRPTQRRSHPVRARTPKETLTVPLVADERVFGHVTVRDPIGDVPELGDEQRALLEALAGHASIALQNGRLLEELNREAQEKAHRALHDSLTGLGNREKFARDVTSALEQRDGSEHVAVLLIDLDRFQDVNDTLGHHHGDELIVSIAGRLRALATDDWSVARLGGDEFGVMVRGPRDERGLLEAARRVLTTVSAPIRLGDFSLEMSGSLGIAVGPGHGTDQATLVQRADVAMYRAKRLGTQIEFYEPEQDPYSIRRLALASELRQAIEHGQLEVHFQPKAKLSNGHVFGAEALVRWLHPRYGYVSPAEFVPLAEQTGLIRPLTFEVIDQALARLARQADVGGDLSVAINLSARTLADAELPGRVHRLLLRHGVAPDRVTFEVTETSIMQDAARTGAILRQLGALGVRLSIDDFGTGYSSLTYLRELSVDELKIDRSFVTDMCRNPNDAVIVRSTIELAHSLGLKVVAEGVEDDGTWQDLVTMGCDVAQGYLIARPMPGVDFDRFVSGRDGAVEENRTLEDNRTEPCDRGLRRIDYRDRDADAPRPRPRAHQALR